MVITLASEWVRMAVGKLFALWMFSTVLGERSIDLTNLTVYWTGSYYLEKESQIVFSSFSDKGSIEATDISSQD